ncbi:hypothetical protein AGR6A_Cc30034 [Agrobacterium sp. NCPPB 925]|nr:hypothetical protein AGR6A_Cc30034 [Agrobacterium sp. NCPPB 925]
MFFLFVSEIVAKRSNTSRINTVRHVYKFKPDSSGLVPRIQPHIVKSIRCRCSGQARA